MSRSYAIGCFIVLGVVLTGITAEAGDEEYQKSLRQLTAHEAVDYYPTWSPDGKYIAFSSRRSGGHIWKIPSAGGTPTQVTEINSNHPSWSPDGLFIAFDTDHSTVVRIIPVDGGAPVRVVPDTNAAPEQAHPCWSRDGSKIAFTAEGNIWTVVIKSGEVSRVFHRDDYSARAFDWSLDGQYIIADVRPIGKSADIWLLPVDGGDPVIYTHTPGGEANPKLSPDGSMIAYTLATRSSSELRIMSAKEKRSVLILSHDGFLANPRWSPDGKSLAFASDEGGNHDIWVMELEIETVRAALGVE